MSLNETSPTYQLYTLSPPIPWNFQNTHDILDQCSYAYPLFISRINRIPPSQFWRVYVLGTIFGLGLLFYVLAFSLVIVRRNKQPLKDRSVFLILISGVSGAVGLAYMYSRLYFDLILVCPITYYIVGLVQFSYFLPYLFRCYRTIMQYKLAYAQSQIMQENEQMLDTNSSIAMQSFNSSYIRRKRRRDNRLAADLSENLLSNLDSSDMSSETSSFGVLDTNILGARKLPLYTTVANSEKYSKLFKNQFYFSERFLVILLTVILLIWATFIFIVHMIIMFSNDAINPTCQKKCNEEEGVAVRIYVCITIILIIPFAYLLMKMRKINDDFSIRKEMTIMLFFSIFVVAVPMIVLIAVPNQFWPQQPTIGYFLGIEVLGSFFISIIYPLSSTWLRNMDMSKFNIFKKKQGNYSISHNIQNDDKEQVSIPDHETFNFYLTDSKGRDVFKQFLVREFHVENLMFCTEVEYYKGLDADDDASLMESSKNLFDTYIQIGAPFEVNISPQLRDEISRQISRQVSKPHLRTFDKAKDEVVKLMERTSFSRFKKSSLYENFISSRLKGTN